MGDLTTFLQDAMLSDYEPQLTALGVSGPADIADVEGAFQDGRQREREGRGMGRGRGGTERDAPRAHVTSFHHLPPPYSSYRSPATPMGLLCPCATSPSSAQVLTTPHLS